MIEPALFTRLSTFAGLTALVSTRVYPGVAPQNAALPFVTYRRVSAVRPWGMGSDAGIVMARVQLDTFALSYAAARSVAEQVRGALQRWRDEAAAVPVLDCTIEGETDLYEPDATPPLFHAVTDVMLTYREG